MKVKKTLHLDPASCTSDQAALVTEEVDRLLAEGKRVTVHIAVEKELLSPRQAAAWLGFSRQHVVRLIGSGELPAKRSPTRATGRSRSRLCSRLRSAAVSLAEVCYIRYTVANASSG